MQEEVNDISSKLSSQPRKVLVAGRGLIGLFRMMYRVSDEHSNVESPPPAPAPSQDQSQRGYVSAGLPYMRLYIQVSVNWIGSRNESRRTAYFSKRCGAPKGSRELGPGGLGILIVCRLGMVFRHLQPCTVLTNTSRPLISND
jgi:hypothetical protein